jgi:hypothetical protein
MKIYLSLCLSTTLFAGQVDALPSFQGFKGVINTPNASVYKEGEFGFLYNNQVDDFTPSSAIDYRDDKEQNNYFLSMGVLPNLDMNIRYANATRDGESKTFLEDRILNLKYQLPFIPKELFQVAVGVQDIAGGASHLESEYAVASKEFQNIRTTVGYAKAEGEGSLDGLFGSVEYQPLTWLNIAGEYDTHDWNAAVKAQYQTQIAKQKINLGLMAKTALDYNEAYVGVYANLPFHDKNQKLNIDTKKIPSSLAELKNYGFSNIAYRLEGDILYFEYENTLYTYSDIDALGMVLGTLAMSDKASTIVVVSKKSNIRQLTTTIKTKEYKEFLETGKYRSNLLQFSGKLTHKELSSSHSDRFKPTLTLKPDFILVDGSEYASVDYTLAMQAELSMRLAKGTIISTRYNVPLAISDNFEEGEVFDYRNRNKTSPEIDQILISQYFQFDLPYRWVSLIQAGQFDRKLTGSSFESSISTLDGRHTVTVKASKLKDDMYKEMDRYYEEDRDEELISYQYYMDSLNANLKITAGDFLYGDSGTMLSLERYFSDTMVQFAISETEHRYKGDNTVAKLTLSVPFGTTQRVKTKYLDIQGDYLTYNRRKTVVSDGEASYAQPLHLKEVDNSFTLEKYYLNNGRFHPAYIKANYNRLRNVFVGE